MTCIYGYVAYASHRREPTRDWYLAVRVPYSNVSKFDLGVA
jgi:hypothetical protein